jgi:hypothetical protein
MKISQEKLLSPLENFWLGRDREEVLEEPLDDAEGSVFQKIFSA